MKLKAIIKQIFGLGVYKVHKMAKSNIKMINIVTLINFKVEKHMLNTVLQIFELDDLKEEASKINSVDCARELNSYYVGNVKSNEVPSSQSVKTR